MGQPSTPDFIARTLIAFVAIFCLANGVFMVAAPLAWYNALPTVPATGPANAHFIVDIGLTYITSGIILFYGLRFPEGRWMAFVAGALWLTAHAVFHIVEVAAGISTLSRFLQDLLPVLGPPLLVFTALGILIKRQRIAPAGLPRATFLRAVDQMMPEESTYFHELADAPGHAFEKFLNFMPATSHRWEAPPELFHLARIGAMLVEDCGPCAMIAAHGALIDGVSRELVNKGLHGGGDLTRDQLCAFQFGRAVAAQAPEAFALGDQIEQTFSRNVRLELALTVALVRGYPGIKRGLGLSKACSLTHLEV